MVLSMACGGSLNSKEKGTFSELHGWGGLHRQQHLDSIQAEEQAQQLPGSFLLPQHSMPAQITFPLSPIIIQALLQTSNSLWLKWSR